MCDRLVVADEAMLRAIHDAGHTPSRDAAVARFSRLGEFAAVWLVVGGAGVALDRENRDRWKRALASVAGAYALNTALKFVIRRRRPALPGHQQLTSTPTQLSFPSAHATSSFAAARAYSAILPAAPLYGLAVALAGSRLYLGVHWPSDTAAGSALGMLVGSAGRCGSAGRRGSAGR